MPLVSFENVKDLKFTQEVANTTSLTYFCFIEDPLHEYKPIIDTGLQRISDDYTAILALFNNVSLLMTKIPVDKALSYANVPLMPKIEYDRSTESRLVSQIARLNDLTLMRDSDLELLDDLVYDSSILLADVQRDVSQLVSTHFLSLTSCSLISQIPGKYLCIGKQLESMEFDLISTQTDFFYSPDLGQYGRLLFQEYRLRRVGQECSVALGDITHYLDTNCCQALLVRDGDLGSCPFSPITNPPQLTKSADGISSLSDDSDIHVRCHNNDYHFPKLDNIISDCSVRLMDTFKHGLGDFISELPVLITN
jgi:hypothetical protein